MNTTHTATRTKTARPGPEARQRLLAEFPLTEHRRDLAGVPTAVLEGGSGPPMIILHGIGQSSLGWIQAVPGLKTSWTLIIPDLPGQGASELPEGFRLTPDRVVDWLDALITATCAAPPVLVGHNVGAAVAARFAARHGDRVAALVLLDALGLGPFRPAPRFALSMAAYQLHATERTRDKMIGQCVVDWDGMREGMGERWDGLADYALDRARTPGVKAAGRTLMKDFALARLPDEDLSRIDVPTSLIWGRRDPEARLRFGEEAADRYGWPLHVIEDCGADAQVERPDALVVVLRKALDTPEPPSE